MATKKTYTVMKDGEEIEKLTTLTAAKKLADTEGAEVFCDGECVYKGEVKDAPELLDLWWGWRSRNLCRTDGLPGLLGERALPFQCCDWRDDEFGCRGAGRS